MRSKVILQPVRHPNNNNIKSENHERSHTIHRGRCTSGFGDKGNFVVTDGGLGRDDPDKDLDIVQEMLKV